MYTRGSNYDRPVSRPVGHILSKYGRSFMRRAVIRVSTSEIKNPYQNTKYGGSFMRRVVIRFPAGEIKKPELKKSPPFFVR